MDVLHPNLGTNLVIVWILFVVISVIAILFTASLWAWVFDVSKFLRNQKKIANTLEEILKELRKEKKPDSPGTE